MSKYEYDCLNTHNCGYDFISNKLESNCFHCGSSFIELNKVVEMKENFTPDRLLGVLTDHGYIQDVGIRYITTTGYLYCEKEDLKFYISDDSDETVSFDEYIKLFYNTEDTL